MGAEHSGSGGRHGRLTDGVVSPVVVVVGVVVGTVVVAAGAVVVGRVLDVVVGKVVVVVDVVVGPFTQMVGPPVTTTVVSGHGFVVVEAGTVRVVVVATVVGGTVAVVVGSVVVVVGAVLGGLRWVTGTVVVAAGGGVRGMVGTVVGTVATVVVVIATVVVVIATVVGAAVVVVATVVGATVVGAAMVVVATVVGAAVVVEVATGKRGRLAVVLVGWPRYTQETVTVGVEQVMGHCNTTGKPAAERTSPALLQPGLLEAETCQSVPAGWPFPVKVTYRSSVEHWPAHVSPALAAKWYTGGTPIVSGALRAGDGRP
jgi:hypothetical protein